MGIYSDVLFPACYDRMMKDEKLDRRRAESLAHVEGEILEVGIGTGLNLAHYPSRVRGITAIDPNPGMARQLEKRNREGQLEVDFVASGAEKMPFADGHFDTEPLEETACTLVLQWCQPWGAKS